MVRLRRRLNCWPSIPVLLLLAGPAIAAPPLPLAGIARVGYRVADAAKSQAFYSGVDNLAPFDRTINWMEYATFGPPFVEPGKTVLDSSGTAIAREGKGLADTPAALRVFQPTPHSGTYYAMRSDPARKEQFFALYRALIGYVFPSQGNDWINGWQENHSITELPWNGQVIARGIEFGSTPFAEGLRASVERGSLLGAPAYRWIGGRQRLKTESTIFLEEIPPDYEGVANAHTEHGIPIVTRR